MTADRPATEVQAPRIPVLRRAVLVLHIAWAIPCLASSILLGVAEGHPPGLIFVPLVVVVWLVGHALLFLLRVLAENGSAGHSYSGSWPASVIAAVTLSGVAVMVGLIAMAWPFLGGAGIRTIALPAIVAGWLLHAGAFTGLLRRKRWSRMLAACLLAAWATLIAAQLIDHLRHGRPIEWLSLATALSIFAACLGLSAHLTWGSAPIRFTRSAR